ncbi:hypothetical protein EDB89DRAFT_2244293 [Lactarius sanguifluus]|nr:hypothetical protein EDB89DRAFT_2244293 [Lactarius sanguifluus]
MSSSLAPSQTCPSPRSVQLPRELWCDITAQILGDYLYDLIIGADTRDDGDVNDENADQRPPTPTHPGDTCRYSVPDRPEWDALATLLHTSRLVRSCTLDHLSFLSHRPDTPSPAPPKAHDGYRPLVAHLHALRRDEIDIFVLEERDYAPGARFFGLPRSIVDPCACTEPEEDQGLPPVLVLARLRHTLAASDEFARAIEKTRNRIEMTQLLLGAKHPGDITDPAVRTSSEDLLVSVKRVLATELNITL